MSLLDQLSNTNILVLKTFADCAMRVQPTAKKTFFSRNAVCYNLLVIYKKTHLNPRDFWDLCKLMQMLKEEEEDAENRGS